MTSALHIVIFKGFAHITGYRDEKLIKQCRHIILPTIMHAAALYKMWVISGE